MEKREMCDVRKEYTSLVGKININSTKYEVAKVKYNDLVSKRDRMLSRKKSLENEIKLLNEQNAKNESEFVSNKHNRLFNGIISLSFVPTIAVDAILLLSGNVEAISNTSLNVALFTGITQFGGCASVYGLMSKRLNSKYRNEYRKSNEYVNSIDKINECERIISDYSECLEDLDKLVNLAQREVINLDNKVRYLNVELRRLEEEISSTKNVEIESQTVRVLNK